jgi:hypothetical protein
VHIFFIDESGTPPGTGKGKDKYFVIGGVCGRKPYWDAHRRVSVAEAPANPPKPPLAVIRREIAKGGGSIGVRQDVFSLAEGEVVLSWPAELSADSIADLKDWLKIVERKITRSEKTAQPEPSEEANS